MEEGNHPDGEPYHENLYSCYVVSEDIDLILTEWAQKSNLFIPPSSFFIDLRKMMKGKLAELLPDANIVFIPAHLLTRELERLTHACTDPIVSLDRVYCKKGTQLESTRLIDAKLKPMGLGSRSQEPLTEQLGRLANQLGNREVQLVDDVLFSGKSMAELIRALNVRGIHISQITVGILIGSGAQQLTEDCLEENPHMQIVSAFHYDSVIDEVCERDFYAGVPFSGRSVGIKTGNQIVPLQPEQGAPYFLPFGDPINWVSIPQDQAKKWSIFCLHQSIDLWKEIEHLSGECITCDMLPRRPAGVPNRNCSFVSYLKHVLRYFE